MKIVRLVAIADGSKNDILHGPIAEGKMKRSAAASGSHDMETEEGKYIGNEMDSARGRRRKRTGR